MLLIEPTELWADSISFCKAAMLLRMLSEFDLMYSASEALFLPS